MALVMDGPLEVSAELMGHGALESPELGVRRQVRKGGLRALRKKWEYGKKKENRRKITNAVVRGCGEINFCVSTAA